MRATPKALFAVLAAAGCAYLLLRSPEQPVPAQATIEPASVAIESSESVADSLEAVDGRRSPVKPREIEGASDPIRVLRVVLDGIAETEASLATVEVGFADASSGVVIGGERQWACSALMSEFSLGSVLPATAGSDPKLRDAQLEVTARHPNRLQQVIRVPLSSGTKDVDGRILYEARLSWPPPVFWPELTLTVRDAHTRAHLEDVELRCVPTAFMSAGWQQPRKGAPFNQLGRGLTSPVGLLGGRDADGPDDLVAGMALQPVAGAAPRVFSLVQPEAVDRGVVVHARAPGYAWGHVVLDVSTGAERELLLAPGAAIDVRLSNVRLDQYAALGKDATLCVVQLTSDGGEQNVWFDQLGESAEAEGVELESLAPGKYRVSVELGSTFSRKKRPVLAREELFLAAGETRKLTLPLVDPPLPPARASVSGIVSFPSFIGEEKVTLSFYETATYRYGGAEAEITMAGLERTGGTPPSWSFRVDNLAVGQYQVQIWPFMRSWMIDLPEGGLDGVELMVPELAEVIVETVDERTGKVVPLEMIRYGSLERLPGQVHKQWVRTDKDGEPGRFRFWMSTGAAFVKTLGVPTGLRYASLQQQDVQLVPGRQSIRFELLPLHAIRFEFRDEGAVVPRDDNVWEKVTRGIVGVDHEGRVTANRLQSERIVEVSAAGTYEVTFEGVGEDRFVAIPSRRVEVRAGETTEVVVELTRK